MDNASAHRCQCAAWPSAVSPWHLHLVRASRVQTVQTDLVSFTRDDYCDYPFSELLVTCGVPNICMVQQAIPATAP